MGKVDSDNEDLIIESFKANSVKAKTQNKNVSLFTKNNNNKSHNYISSLEHYKELYDESLSNPSSFWAKMASQFVFRKIASEKVQSPKPILNFNFDPRKGPIFTNFMEDYETNVCYNVLDRHVKEGRGEKVAFYWEGNDPSDAKSITYSQLYGKVCKFSNALKSLGVEKGDIVAIYMPMILETVVAMLATARIGAVHSVIFAGYSSQAVADRLIDGNCRVLLTTDGAWRGDKFMGLKEICDEAILKAEAQEHNVPHCVMLRHLERLTKSKTGSFPIVPFNEPRDKDWEQLVSVQSRECPPVWVRSEDPLFTLYTSGSSGKPKGVVHSTGGYLVFASTVFKYSFDFNPDKDVIWCTSDLGWCCAHTNLVYGPLSLGGTSVLFEGTPFYPSVSRPWEIVDKYSVSVLYTAPTVLRHLQKFGNALLAQYELASLRILGTVGEPINKSTWDWYFSVVGGGRCPIVDTYGQTETGGHLLTNPAPRVTQSKPGAVGLPFFGSSPVLLTKDGQEIVGEGEGVLAFKAAWPCVVRTIHGNKELYENGYFGKFPGYYCTGDGARRDSDGYYYITGRVDDMLNVSGHLLSTTSVEAALLEDGDVAEVAVVPVAHKIKGQSLHAFVILKQSGANKKPESIMKQLQQKVRDKVGSFAVPDVVLPVPSLPMTRSGKILRRVLVTIAERKSDFGDTSTLLEESVLATLQNIVNDNRPNRL